MPEHDETPIARLVALTDEVAPGELLLSAAEHTLGRSSMCDVVVRRQTVSRLHARIVREGPRHVLHDSGSANGTFVNGQQLTGPHLLSNRDAIGLGAAAELLRFVDPDPTVVPASRLRLDERAQLFYLGAQPLELTPGQHRLLTHLYRHLGELCTRESCAEAIWGRDYDPGLDAEALDRAVSNLRGALRRAGQGGELLQTRRGMGYVLLAQPAEGA
ncbi:MAG TPA: FHA domain-containing protein [Chloroflexaceae bacterium]|nr:FHA domain-containing protein [Chloroflexaceae bacterium]